MRYSIDAIKKWDVLSYNGKSWVMARPLNRSPFAHRVMHAIGVLTGEYDVLEWGSPTQVQPTADKSMSCPKCLHGVPAANLIKCNISGLIEMMCPCCGCTTYWIDDKDTMREQTYAHAMDLFLLHVYLLNGGASTEEEKIDAIRKQLPDLCATSLASGVTLNEAEHVAVVNRFHMVDA